MSDRRKTIILGIDGMDFDYAQAMIDDLPIFKSLSTSGVYSPFESVFPPDSIPSWVTCYTGKDPSQHGVLESVNYLAKGDDRLKVDTSSFKGITFWDLISDAGNSVCVINPFMAYPVWPVNGVMINGPVFIDGGIQISAPDAVAGIPVPDSLGGIVDFPTKDTLKEFVAKTYADTQEQAAFGIEVMKKMSSDLFFQTFLTMDRIQHFLWRYCDKNDPTHPGSNPQGNAIREFYIAMDKIVGQYIDEMTPEDRLIIISDHGHGMRCTECFNINELLREHGYVRSVAEGKVLSKQLILEKCKNAVLEFMHKNDLEDYISKIAKFVPNAKKMKTGKHITSDNKNKAYASDFTGTNPFGGICINRELVDNYAATRADIIKLLEDVRQHGEPVFEWIKHREDLYSGTYLERFPDILFCLKSRFGVNWSLHTKLFTTNPTHKKVSGGHKQYGVFFSNIPALNFETSDHINMTNFAPTILHLFGLGAQDYFSGKSFYRSKK